MIRIIKKKVEVSAGIHNLGFNEGSLFIIKAEVNEGTAAKRCKPRARGRSYMIKRPTCHITIVLKDISLDEYEYRDYLDCSKRTG